MEAQKHLLSLMSESENLVSSIPDSILRSNMTTLSETQLSSIEQIIESTEQGNAVLDTEIAALNCRINACKKALGLRVAHVERHQRLLSASRRIPREIWTRIFSFALSDDDVWSESFDISETPILLTHICRTWRDIAVSTPSLWSRISCTLAESPDSSTLMWLHIFLTRSQSSLLVIELDIDKEINGSTNVNLFYRLLLGQSTRWKEIEFFVPHDHFHQYLFPSPVECPSLEKVSLHPSDSDTCPSWKPFIFTNARPKSFLIQIGDKLGQHVSSDMLDWSGLSSLGIIVSLKISKLLGILRQASNLEDLKLEKAPLFESNPPIPLELLSHNRLKHLEIGNGCCCYLSEKLSLPALISLKLGRSCHGPKDFLDKSKFLEKLEVQTSWFRLLINQECFQRLRSLTLLVTTGSNQADLLDIIADLGGVSPKASLVRLPSLTSFHIELLDVLSEVYESVFCNKLCTALLSLSRQLLSNSKPHSAPRLESITLLVHVRRNSFELEAFSQLRMMGFPCLDVDIHQCYKDDSSASSDLDGSSSGSQEA